MHFVTQNFLQFSPILPITTNKEATYFQNNSFSELEYFLHHGKTGVSLLFDSDRHQYIGFDDMIDTTTAARGVGHVDLYLWT